jgi:outer membrane receptor protein involved in Fe transport
LRGNFGARLEDGYQDVRSFDPFNNDSTVQEGKLSNRDLLPSMNMTWGPTDHINVRLAASRTVSRPDLNELSPSPTLEYEGGAMKLGNPRLQRAKAIRWR